MGHSEGRQAPGVSGFGDGELFTKGSFEPCPVCRQGSELYDRRRQCDGFFEPVVGWGRCGIQRLSAPADRRYLAVGRAGQVSATCADGSPRSAIIVPRALRFRETAWWDVTQPRSRL